MRLVFEINNVRDRGRGAVIGFYLRSTIIILCRCKNMGWVTWKCLFNQTVHFFFSRGTTVDGFLPIDLSCFYFCLVFTVRIFFRDTGVKGVPTILRKLQTNGRPVERSWQILDTFFREEPTDDNVSGDSGVSLTASAGENAPPAESLAPAEPSAPLLPPAVADATTTDGVKKPGTSPIVFRLATAMPNRIKSNSAQYFFCSSFCFTQDNHFNQIVRRISH